MKTTISYCDPKNIDYDVISAAATLINTGEVVAFPTETVYGLGADALNPQAVEKIFAAKNRPADNPLIVHISQLSQLETLVTNISPAAQKLIDAFWPGPLSIVFKKQSVVPDITTGNLDTVVIRLPSHPIARALIQAAGTPIAAPSANLSGRVSPTLATHVTTDLDGKIPLIIDGGAIEFGIESTVIDCSTATPVILRPGSITKEMLETIVDAVETSTDQSVLRSPGTKYRHYSPTAPVILFTGKNSEQAIHTYLSEHPTLHTGLIWHTGVFHNHPANIQLSSNPSKAAQGIFRSLRELDCEPTQAILVQGYFDNDVGAGIMNRLQKAASTTYTDYC